MLVSVLVWSVLFISGYFMGGCNTDNSSIAKITKISKERSDNHLNVNIGNHINSFLFLLKSNLRGWLIMVVLGPLTLGSFTLINLGVNSAYIGYLLKSASDENLLKLVLPHGIFEIPAIIIAGAAGFKIPYEITRYLAGRKEQILTRQDIKDYVTLALISIALIIIAAWVEANITLRIAESMMNSSGG